MKAVIFIVNMYICVFLRLCVEIKIITCWWCYSTEMVLSMLPNFTFQSVFSKA